MSLVRTWTRRSAGSGPGQPSVAGPALALARWRRGLQIALGLIWLLDAALQYQPYMFTTAFARDVLTPAGEGSPAVVHDPVSWSASLVAAHPVLWNTLFATIQLLLAVGLLRRPTVRAALAASAAWALGVWWIGEGAGGLLASGIPSSTDAPGAALLYVLLAAVIWPARQQGRTQDPAPGASVATTGPLGTVAPRVAWALLWAGLGYLVLQPASRAAGSVTAMLTEMKDGEPGWIAAIDSGLARTLAGHGAVVAIALAVLCTAAVLGIAAPPRLARIGVLAAALVSLVIWVLQDFGEIFTGQGTDPNSGLLLLAIAAAFWPLTIAPGIQPADSA